MKKKKEKIAEENVEVVDVVKEKKQDINVPEYYTLRIGETLKDVAERFGLDEKKLEKINGEVVGTNQIKLK